MEIEIGKFKIFISENVKSILNKYKQNNRYKNESGGILLGYIIDDSVYIEKISIPNKFDKASRYSFERNQQAAQLIIDYEFINSQGQTIYLGEWHTHPEINPKPSKQDLMMIKDQIKKGKLNEPFILMLIQGTESIFLNVYTN